MSGDALWDLARLYAWTAPALLVMARVIGLLVTAPVIGGPYAPTTVKAFAALALTGVLAPGRLTQMGAGLGDTLPYVVALISELGVGLVLGFLIDLFFQAVQFGGDLMGRIAGYAAAEVFDPGSGGMSGPIGNFLHLAAVLLLFMVDGHHLFIVSLDRSFDVIALGTWTPGPHLHAATHAATQQFFTLAITLAMPVMAAIFAVAMAEGVIARTIPQINILHITFAIKIAVFMLVLYAGLPAAVAFLSLIIVAAQEFAFAILPVMGAG